MKIETMKQLRAEKALCKIRLREHEINMLESLEELKEEIAPKNQF